jgi:hypothetical protein
MKLEGHGPEAVSLLIVFRMPLLSLPTAHCPLLTIFITAARKSSAPEIRARMPATLTPDLSSCAAPAPGQRNLINPEKKPSDT